MEVKASYCWALVTESTSHRRLIKSPKYLFFDLGFRRACTKEGEFLSEKTLANLFEEFIGLELIHQIRDLPHGKLRYWRDSNGVEVDYILVHAEQYIPIEVKWSEKPSIKDARYLQKFLSEYKNADKGSIVCRTPRPYKITENIIALPWQELKIITREI